MADPAGGAAAVAAVAAAADDPEGVEEGTDSEEEASGDEGAAVNPAAIQQLVAAFRASLVNIFGYSAVSAQAIQEHLSLTEPVDLETNWLDDEDLRTACTTLTRNAKDFKVGNVKPVFRLSLATDLILYRDWVSLRLARGLRAEATNFRQSQRQFMLDWRRESKDIRAAIKNASAEPEVEKFNQKDWLKWYHSIDNYFRRTLGVRGVTVDWVYREQARPTPRVFYPSIVDELKATFILTGTHFKEDSKTVYDAVARSTFDTPAYPHVRRFEKQRDGRQAMLTLKVQFGGTSFNMSRSNTAHDFLEKATFSGPKRGYTYLEHVSKFNNAYNELELIGEPLPEHVKVRKFCLSLTEPCMKGQVTGIMTSPETENDFALATARIQTIRDAALKLDAAASGRSVGETGTGRRGGGGGGGGHPRKRRKKKGGGAGGGAGGLQLHGYTDQQWHALTPAVQKRVKAGRAAEKAALREASATASAKPDADKDKEAEKGGARFGKGAHA